MTTEQTYMDFPRLTHEGKYGVVYDYAITEDGGLYYASIVGSRQMCEGIAAALLDSGRRNNKSVYLATPTDGSDGVFNTSKLVHVAHNTVGAMRRITRKVQGTRLFEVVLLSNLVKWDYNYAHIQRKNALEEKDDSEYEKNQQELALRRFVLLADEEESEHDTARRWFAYLPKRVSEPMLAEWAVPLWEYCSETGTGMKKLQRLRGSGWLCEPSSEALRGAISDMGHQGRLPLPDSFKAYIAERSTREYDIDYAAMAVAAD